MINLLPTDLKEAYYYSRRNRILAHWVIIIVFCWFGGVALTISGVAYMNRDIVTTKKQLSDTQKQLNSLHEAAIQQQVTTISNNLKLATQVLSKEVLFSSLLKQLGAVTPPNVILTNLTITQTQGGVDITAQTTDYTAAAQLQANLADPNNKIFSQADIESIDCTNGSSVSSSPTTPAYAGYPCAVTIRALFAKNNPFLFINNSTGGGS